MDNESRRIGARSRRYVLWAAGHILSELTKRPVGETLSKVLKTYGDSLKPSDVRGVQDLQKVYEHIHQRARDISRTLAGGLNIDDPAVIRTLTSLHLTEANEVEPEAETAPADSAEAFLAEVFAETATTATTVSADDGFFDDLPSAGQADAPAVESALANKIVAALQAYGRYLNRHQKVPLVPYTRPDLGVTFFPSGRFDAAGVDWNYNGQVGGEMIRECGDDKLVFAGPAPLKSIIEFKDWSFTRNQKVSGTIWVWAVSHVESKQVRFWFNDGDDRVRFYYTMTSKGVIQVLKKPSAPGSKKFVKVDERLITPIDLDA